MRFHTLPERHRQTESAGGRTREHRRYRNDSACLTRLDTGQVTDGYSTLHGTVTCRLTSRRRRCFRRRAERTARSSAPRGGWGQGHRPLQIAAGPPDLAVLLTHRGQSIPRKINKVDATICQILRQKYKIRFPLGLCPIPRWGSLQYSPDP